MDSSKIDELILNGGLEVSGITEDGNFTFVFTDKLKEVDPEVYEAVISHFYSLVTMFWEKGFLEFDIAEDNPLVRLTEKVFDKVEVDKLSEIEKINLNLMIQALAKE